MSATFEQRADIHCDRKGMTQTTKTPVAFRSSAAFGKRIEFYVVGLMLKEGLDVYLPLVDDDAIDAVVKRPDGTFVEVQIKARSSTVAFGSAAQFSSIVHKQRSNYWFVFYSDRLDKTWIMSSKEFVKHSVRLKTGGNIGKRSIWFNGTSKTKREEYVKKQFEQFVATDFSRILNEHPDA